MRRKVVFRAAAVLLFAYLALPLQAAMAADPIGTVKTSSGEAQITRSGSSSAATVGNPVHQNDVVITGADGALGITFTDGTLLSVGPNTEIIIDTYVYNPNASDSSFTASMARGTLQFISGEIAKLSPDAVKVNTPTGTIAVRGTRFLVEVEQPEK